MLKWPDKDPDDVLDYGIEWAAEIAPDDQIETSEWLPAPGLSFGLSSVSGTRTTVWISGGVKGSIYFVTNRIRTASGRQMDRSVRLIVRDR